MKIASTQYSINTKSLEIYLSGCNGNPKCEQCHNPELWDFDIGKEYSDKYFETLRKKVSVFDSMIDNIFVLGGEPLDQNIIKFKHMIKDLRKLNKKLWLFTRYEITEIDKEIKNAFDYIKTGKYIMQLQVEDNVQYGIKLASANQKIYKKGKDYD